MKKLTLILLTLGVVVLGGCDYMTNEEIIEEVNKCKDA